MSITFMSIPCDYAYLLRHINGTDVQLVNTTYATQEINYLNGIFNKNDIHTAHTYQYLTG